MLAPIRGREGEGITRKINIRYEMGTPVQLSSEKLWTRQMGLQPPENEKEMLQWRGGPYAPWR